MKSNRIQKPHVQSIGKPRKTKQRKKFLKLLCASLLSFIFALSSIHAQTTLTGDHIITGNLDVGNAATKGNLKITGQTGNTALPGLKITGDGGVVFQGTYGTGLIPATGSGIRVMWYPKKAAFRAGMAGGTEWDDTYIGACSVAFGSYTTASGDFSTAFGNSTMASGLLSTTFGEATTASGSGATAFGIGTQATGEYATAFGDSTIATGYAATALGVLTQAIGDYAIALGEQTGAQAYSSLVIGRNNIMEGNSGSWLDTDPVFVIGNGTGAVRHNALTIYKNGKMSLFGSSPTTPTIVLDPNTSQITVGGQPLIAPNASGYVGIGTATPTYPLDVKGNVRLADQGRLFLGQDIVFPTYSMITTDSESRNIQLTAGGGTSIVNGAQLCLRAANQNGSAILGAASTGSVDFFAGGATRMRIQSGGNVGIGTTNPNPNGVNTKLNVFGNTNSNVTLELTGNQVDANGAVQSDLAFSAASNTTGTNGTRVALIRAYTSGTVATNRGGDLGFYTKGDGSGLVERMRVLNNGNVGIGTSTPQAKLDVQGDMRVAGAIRIPAAGDLSMGTFTSGTQP